MEFGLANIAFCLFCFLLYAAHDCIFLAGFSFVGWFIYFFFLYIYNLWMVDGWNLGGMMEGYTLMPGTCMNYRISRVIEYGTQYEYEYA